MGVTLDGPNTSIDFGGGGFMRLRLKVAELTAEDIFEHYKNLCNNMFKMSPDDFQEYDAKTESLNEKYIRISLLSCMRLIHQPFLMRRYVQMYTMSLKTMTMILHMDMLAEKIVLNLQTLKKFC